MASFLILSFMLTLIIFFGTENLIVKSKVVFPLIHIDTVFTPISPLYIKAPVLAEKGRYMFLVNVSIGDPPVSQLLVLDGGSSFTWFCTTNCAYGTYKAVESSTAEYVNCTFHYECNEKYNSGYMCYKKRCTYLTRYYDGRLTRGFLATEKLTFETSTGGISNVRAMVGIEVFTIETVAGMVKVGNLGTEPTRPDTVTYALGRNYSYCLGNISDTSYKYSHLTLGNGAYIGDNNRTPLKLVDNHFLINFQGIKIDGLGYLDIDNKELGYNTLLDPGSSYSQLRRGVYEKLKKEIEKILFAGNVNRDATHSSDNRPCYQGNINRDVALAGFPTISMRFEQESDLYLVAGSVFDQQLENVFCLAILPRDSGVNLVGAYGLQFQIIGFDMTNMEASFVMEDCDVLF